MSFERSHMQYPCAAIVFSASSFLPVTKIFPLSDISSAIALPIPFEAPVTSMFKVFSITPCLLLFHLLYSMP